MNVIYKKIRFSSYIHETNANVNNKTFSHRNSRTTAQIHIFINLSPVKSRSNYNVH